MYTPLLFSVEEDSLNIQLLNKARERVPSIPVLINMVSKRVKQLNAGFRPFVKPSGPNEDKVDLALREISEGAIIAQFEFTEPDPEESPI